MNNLTSVVQPSLCVCPQLQPLVTGIRTYKTQAQNITYAPTIKFEISCLSECCIVWSRANSHLNLVNPINWVDADIILSTCRPSMSALWNLSIHLRILLSIILSLGVSTSPHSHQQQNGDCAPKAAPLTLKKSPRVRLPCLAHAQTILRR